MTRNASSSCFRVYFLVDCGIHSTLRLILIPDYLFLELVWIVSGIRVETMRFWKSQEAGAVGVSVWFGSSGWEGCASRWISVRETCGRSCTAWERRWTGVNPSALMNSSPLSTNRTFRCQISSPLFSGGLFCVTLFYSMLYLCWSIWTRAVRSQAWCIVCRGETRFGEWLLEETALGSPFLNLATRAGGNNTHYQQPSQDGSN